MRIVNKPIVIFRGDNTSAFNLRSIKIILKGDLDLSNAIAKFSLLDYRKEWTAEEVASGELTMSFTSTDTKAMPLGEQTGTFRLYDMSTGEPRQLTIVNKIPFFVTNRVCELDNESYHADVSVASGEIISIEFNVGVGAVNSKADKVKNAVDGDLAGLDGNGNLTDSGIQASDVLRKSQMDATPTAGSLNPVTSDGIKQAIEAAKPSDYEQVKAQVTQNASDIDAIEAKIPSQASAQNQLADKDFVNSSIATNTATFRGTYNLVTDLGLTTSATHEQVAAAIKAKLAALSITPENNDYCFVQVPKSDAEPTVIVRVDRYKCTVEGGVSSWDYEWSLNNSSFTAEQWAAINSGITSALVEKLGALPSVAELTRQLLAKYEKPSGGIPKTDLSAGVQASLDKADSALQGATLGGTTVPISVMDRILEIPMSEPIPEASYVGAADAYHTWLQIQQRAMKATNPTADNLAALDANGNPIDSGIAKTSIAPLASPAFTGTPTAPTPTAGDDSTKVATTAFVQGALPYAIASVPSGDALADRTVNTKTVNAATYAPSFPAETSGKSCDFYLAITSDTAGTVSAPSGKTLYNAKGESANLDYEANKTTVLRFTQIGTNTYVVTGGANGGGSIDPATLNTKANSTALAPDWRAGNVDTAYAVNNYITYNGNAYVCMVAYTATSSSPTPDNDIYNDTVTPATGHWKLTDMTTPDATLDVTSQGSLRVVSAGGQTLWQQGYKLASASSATLSNEGVNIFTFAAVAAFDDTASYAIGDTVAYDGKAYTFTSAHSGAWTGSDVELAAQSFSLPAAPTGKVGDFILEIDNTANASVDVAIDIAEYTNTTISLVIPDGAAIDDMTTIGGGVRCEFYFTQTAFNVNSKPTWKVVRQDVEVVA